MPIADIRSTPLRRLSVSIAYPALTIWHYRWSVPTWPLRCLWAMAVAAGEEAAYEWRAGARDRRLLAVGFRAVWAADWHTDQDAAIKRAAAAGAWLAFFRWCVGGLIYWTACAAIAVTAMLVGSIWPWLGWVVYFGLLAAVTLSDRD